MSVRARVCVQKSKGNIDFIHSIFRFFFFSPHFLPAVCWPLPLILTPMTDGNLIQRQLSSLSSADEMESLP